uniref:Uncharacterized protein n=1 Tax=Avena sativa TaxID=4498 RepID=A0ACD5V793_AVESA
MDSLRAEVGDLRSRVIDITKLTATSPKGAVLPPPLKFSADAPPSSSAAAKPAVVLSGASAVEDGGDDHGQFGLGDASNPRGPLSDDLVLSEGAPAKGKPHLPCPGSDSSEWVVKGCSSSRFPPPPRVDFPIFDGENPSAWRLKAEAYFQVCAMNPDTWVNCAAMYFMDDALSWLQASKAHLQFPAWKEFVEIICNQFGRTEFQNYLRQFNRLQQTGTVVEYASKFNTLMHNLTAHHNSWEPSFFVTHFIDGLHRDIRAAVVLHRPLDLPTAVDLAILQEEVIESFRRDARRMEFSPVPRNIPRTALPLLPPPQPRGHVLPAPQTEERRVADMPKQIPADDKIAALRAYRRARGLCFTCGERWGREHRCGPTVQLHVVEELLAMVQSSDDAATIAEPVGSDTGSQLMHISEAAVAGGQGATTMRFQGRVQNQDVLMLVDSRSSHTFISSEFAERLQLTPQNISPLRVKVANGGGMHCTQELQNVSWWTQGVQFSTSFKLLPLGSYDIILGFDWLSSHSPMNVHWGNQTMNFQMGGRTVYLSGAQSDPTQCKEISVDQMRLLLHHSKVARVVHVSLVIACSQYFG